MSRDDELARWYHQLRAILDAATDATRTLGVARASGAISDNIDDAASSRAEEVVTRIVELVAEANASAERIHQADPRMAAVVHPLLGVPGAPPEIDLRPWWSRLLQKVSATARRADAAESLETLRLEADAALVRAGGPAREARVGRPAISVAFGGDSA